MRPITLLTVVVAATASLLACGGEVAPDTSGQTASQQKAGSPNEHTDPPAAWEPTSSATASGGSTGGSATDGSERTTAEDAEYPPPTWGMKDGGCLLDPGPDAPGACKVGAERECPDTIARGVGASSSGGLEGCRQMCVNVKGTARWSQPSKGWSLMTCAYYDTNLNAGHCGCNTPLVLSFDNGAVAFDAGTQTHAAFDLTRNGMSHASDWPTATTPWLALDRDGNGTIDSGAELFGSATRLSLASGGGFATNGFEALRDLDDDKDGVFDARDAAFAKIVVWSDRNADRVSTPDELTSLAEAGVKAIDLHDRRDMRCDARGNCEGERSRFTMADGRRGTVIDVYLPSR